MMPKGDAPDTGFFRRVMELTRRPESQKMSFFTWLRRRLAVGFMVAFPLVVTVFFARFLFELLDRWFRPISRQLFGFPLVGVGLVLSLIAMLFLGILATNVLGSRLLNLFERRISRLPLLSPIYQGARQITEAIQISETTQFRKVVLIRFPHPGVQSIAFVTREFNYRTQFAGTRTTLVFVPTTPNPTSGYLVAVPHEDVEPVDISVEEGVKMVISGGLLTPAALLKPAAEESGETRTAGEVPRPPESSQS